MVNFLHKISQAKNKLKKLDNSTTNRNSLNQTYQQYEFLNMQSTYEMYFNSLQFLAKKETVNSQVYSKFLESPKKYLNSLLTFGKRLIDLLLQEKRIRIIHQHYCSQIIILSFFLKHSYPEKQITIFTSQINFKNWQKYFIDEKHIDKESELKALLKKEKINFSFIKDSLKNQQTSQNHIFIFDLMNVEFIEYFPFLISKTKLIQNSQKVIFYQSNYQQNEISSTLKELKIQLLPVQVQLSYPIQIQFILKDSEIKMNLIQFLKQDSLHPDKQDIIIFYKNQHLSNSNSKRFIMKLKQNLTEHNLLKNIQFIHKKNQTIQPGKNHIFITENVNQLLQWNYCYSQVFYVIDYGWDVSFRMDSQYYCYIDGLNKEDLTQKARRISFIGINKVGKYIYRQQEITENLGIYEKATNLSNYILKMINLEYCQFIDHQNKRIQTSIQALIGQKIIEKNGNNQYKIIDHQIINYTNKGIDPIQAKIIKNSKQLEKYKEQKTLTNLIILSFTIINTPGNLRQNKDINGSKYGVKPTGIWRKTGYLHSSIQILTKAELIEQGKNHSKSYSRKKTKHNQAEHQVYGNLFQIIVPKKIEFRDMQMQDLMRQYFVNSDVFIQIREKVEQTLELFEVDKVNIKIDDNKSQEIVQVVEKIASFLTNSVAFYSGSRRDGYYFKNNLKNRQNIFPNKDSLIAQLNEFSQFLLVLRCSQIDGKKQILLCNSLMTDSYLHIFGQLPPKISKSSAQKQIQMHGISSSVFKGLFHNNSLQLKKFQDEYKCQIQTNQQMATINICCDKQNHQKIKQAFDILINKIKQKYVNYDKIVHYLGNTNISLSNGGVIKEVIKNNYINRCYLNNLDLQITQQDLEELFDQFFVLRDIQILNPEPNKFSKSAIIQFASQKDYYRFYSYYNQCKYLGRHLEVRPIFMDKIVLNVLPQNYIQFKWYVWKSNKKAIIVFEKLQNALEANKKLTQNNIFDGKPVKFQLDGNKLIFHDLDESVDQIFLQKGFSIYGPIKQVQILKLPIKEAANPQSILDSQIRIILNIPKNQNIQDRFAYEKVQKHKNGLRKCKVTVKRQQDLNILINNLNQVKNKNIGQGRLYAQSWYTKPVSIIYPGVLNLYLELLQQTIDQTTPKPYIQHEVKDLGNNRMFIILKSRLKNTLDLIINSFESKLLPSNIQLTTLQKQIIITDVGIDNLIDLQQKYFCKLVANTIKKQLGVICSNKNLKKIKQQVIARVEDKFFYRISLNNNSYKKLINDQEKIKQIKYTYFLSILQIQDFSKTLIFEGSAHHVQNALNYLMHLIQSFTVPQQQLINTQFCLICYTQCLQPYRLQNCGHKFCFGCLDQCVNSTLGDMSMFPIKCPHCSIQVTIDDLQSLIDKNSWPKLLNMTANQYVGKHSQIMTFCYTAGCKQICMISLNYFKCDLCAQSYCMECKEKYHPNITCQQAKLGTDQLFKKYMKQNGIRVCPYKSCGMPIIRTDGCYRVTCSRCNKSMCFKCDPDKMIPYDDYNECYKHLNDIHGGYW